MEHGLRIRIRNHLPAQYFPETDKFCGHGESGNPAIVRWCLRPDVISGLGYEKFFQMVTTRDKGISQENRLRAIWNKRLSQLAVM